MLYLSVPEDWKRIVNRPDPHPNKLKQHPGEDQQDQGDRKSEHRPVDEPNPRTVRKQSETDRKNM